MDEPSGRGDADKLPGDKLEHHDGESRAQRFRPGFPWGLAAGALAGTLIVVCGLLVFHWMELSKEPSFSGGPSEPRVSVSPVKAGRDWFSIAANGGGTLSGWSDGSSGSGSDEPAGTIAYFTIGAVGGVSGVPVTHLVKIYVSHNTKIIIGGQPYNKGRAASSADAVFASGGGPSNILESRLLTVDFHRVGGILIADRITAPIETGTSPLDQ